MLPILIAVGWQELLQAGVMISLLIIWIISQIVDAKKGGGQPRQAGRPVPPPAPAGQGPERAAAARPPGDPLRDQVDEFLRRAGQQRPPEARPPRQPQPTEVGEIEILLDEETEQPERRPLAEPLRPVSDRRELQPSPAKGKRPRPAPAVEPRRESIADHVAQHVSVGSRSLADQTSRLGARIVEEDQQFDRQLHARFEHRLGSLTPTPASQPEQAPPPDESPAGRIAAMLSNPDGVRQAMILNEVLNRPSDRW